MHQPRFQPHPPFMNNKLVSRFQNLLGWQACRRDGSFAVVWPRTTHASPGKLVRQQIDNYECYGLPSSSTKSTGCSTVSGQRYIYYNLWLYERLQQCIYALLEPLLLHTPGILVRQQLDNYQRCRLRSSSRKSMGWSTISGQLQVTAYAYTNSSTGFALSYFCTIFYGHPHAQLAYFLVSNWKTTNATDSVPPGAKARYVLLFLDSGMLQLALTRAAREALHNRPFCTIFYGHPLAQCTCVLRN